MKKSDSISQRHDPRILSRQVAQVYRMASTALLLTVVATLVLAWLLASFASPQALALWALAMVAVAVVRYVGVRRYQRAPIEPADAPRWAQQCTIGVLVSGLLWSMLGTAFFPAQALWPRTLIGFVIAGITAVSLVALGPLASAYRAFVLGILLPISAYNLYLGGEDRTPIGLIVLGYGIIMLLMGRAMNRNALAMLQAQADTEALAEQLATTTREITRTNTGLSREIAERQRTEESVRGNEARLRLALESAGMITWEFDCDTHRLTLDGILEQAVGLVPRPDGTVPAIYKLVHPDDLPHFLAASERALYADEPFRCEYRMTIHGRERWVASRGRMEPDRSTRSRRMIGVSQDVTARKRAEAELHDAKDAAEAANRAKSQFLANMSHEIRTPMNGVLGMIELLERSGLNPAQQRLATTARQSGEALLAVLNDILDFSKIEAGRLHIESIPCDITRLVEDVMALFMARAHDKGLTLTYHLAPDVPAILYGDPHRLRQILINLVGNALKFTEHGEVLLQVTCDVTPRPADEAHVRFTVRDTGIGLSHEESTRLFKAFSQADDSTTRQFGGTGLGLAISKQLVELMRGDIGLESEPGRGSMFWFVVPLGLAPTTILPEGLSTRHGTRGEVSTSEGNAVVPSGSDDRAVSLPVRVLVVEDNPVNQEVAREMLTAMGCEVRVVPNGFDAVETTLHEQFDIIFMDCQMPVMDGFEASQLIRTRENASRRTPIVALTGNAMSGDHERCLAAGMDAYLSKPFSFAALRAMVRRLALHAPETLPTE